MDARSENPIPSLEQLWDADEDAPTRRFEPALLDGLPGPARRYLQRSIEPGAPLYRAVRLRMHGEIKLGSWRAFEAEQVLRVGRGLVWRAKAHMLPLVDVKGHDAYVDGVGEMRWKLLGLIPVMTAEGPDISRSAAARAELESYFLPTSLLDPSVSWSTSGDDEHAEADVTIADHTGHIRLRIDPEGRLLEISSDRWGNPEGGDYHPVPFGGIVSEERKFGPLTVPTVMRAGWYFGSERFEQDGEFFRATIDAMEFR